MSHDSPESTNCRGIINPNYPGFQHLAHTLSEHFFDHQFEHSSEDSDLSEFETESSRENSPDQQQPQNVIDNNNRNSLNNNNNNNGNLDKIEDILKGAFVSRESMLPTEITADEDEHGDGISTVAGYDLQSTAVLPVSGADRNFNTSMQINDIESAIELTLLPVREDDDDLETYLSRYESPVELKSPIEQVYQPPDLLLKSSPTQNCTSLEDNHTEKPDILHHVEEQQHCESEVSVEKSATEIVSAEWGGCGMTPVVDIVGNFEQEVEHEIGLIVSGYKSSTSSIEELSALAAALEQATSELYSVEQSLDKVSIEQYKQLIMQWRNVTKPLLYQLRIRLRVCCFFFL